MKNSLFKRVAAAAAAVPIALTQCLTFTSAAAGNDAVQDEGNKKGISINKDITIERLVHIDPSQPESTWNSTVGVLLLGSGGSTGEVDLSSYADKIAGKFGKGYGKTAEAMLKEYVLSKPAKYVIDEKGNIIINIDVQQINWNESLAYTPQDALEQIASGYGVDALKSVDFSSVVAAGTIEVTLKTSDLLTGTDVPVAVRFKPADSDKYINADEFITYCNNKLADVRKCGNDAIDAQFTGALAAKKDEAHKKFNDKIDLIANQFNRVERNINNFLKSDKEVSYDSLAEAATAANNYLHTKELYNKKIGKNVPTSAQAALAKDSVKKSLTNIISIIAENAKSANVKITADEVGQFVDSLGSRSLTEANGEMHVTDFSIKANNKTATIVGAFDDDEADEVKAYVENQGYEYIGSYKKLTSKINFNGINTFDVGDVDVKIERILVTNTTTTAPVESTTTDVTETTSTTTDVTGVSETTSTTTDVTGVSETTSTTTDVTGVSETTSTTTSTGTGETSTTTTTTTGPVDKVTTSVIASVYVDIETTHGFYLNTETSFDASQIKKATLHVIYAFGYMDGDKPVVTKEVEGDTIDVTGKIGFGNATPANTYKKVENKFDYDVQLTYEGETIKDKDGNQIIAKGTLMRDKNANIATALVYIGVKGDTNLDNIVDGRDASAAQTYYAKVSTDRDTVHKLSPNAIVTSADSELDDFAAFLTDVKWDAENRVERTAKKTKRVIDSRDASSIQTFYSIASTDQYKEIASTDPEQIWAKAAINSVE